MIGILGLVGTQVIQLSAVVRADTLLLVLCGVMFRTGFKTDGSTEGRLREETHAASFCHSHEMTLVIPPSLQRLQGESIIAKGDLCGHE